ncbi:choice-of-anchor D domain-containing protein [Luteolibacter arcticus]|uniref:Choice-of-anchor D domain-containing protein n=1 Tax=Luteolibacter arcticus TaxID=1581411 RepID=A0ABT3GR69_9BACT|nr:LamG-like jellyroll fold domain-containing protein [Luteolibacter arcticus]MCW1925976.1 choice-of-anchor D domain-containing protein [Luteolibacter arcticus]
MKPVDRAYALALSLLCVGTSNTHAEIIAATHVDWSNTGYVSPTVQNPVSGFSYGYYPANTGTTGTFSTAGMFAVTNPDGQFWNGADGGNTPAQSQYDIHPGLGGVTAVRRYTVSSGSEPLVSGPVRVVGRFFELNSGFTHVFVTTDPDGDAGPAERTTIVPSQDPVPTPSVEVTLPKPIPFDVTLNVSPGATIDFGALAMDNAYSDSTGLIAWIVNGNTAVPTNLVSSQLGSPDWGFFNGYQDVRGLCYGMATDGVTGGTDQTTFDLTGGGYPYQYAGLLYLENAGSGKATRFDSMRIDVTSANDFPQAPQLFLLRHNSDPASINPVADDRYERLPVAAVRHAANTSGQPYYTFDLTSLPVSQRAGYGFAVLGSSVNNSTPITVSEISAVASRVSSSEVVSTKPFLVEWTNGHRYGVSATRGTWEQVQAEAAALGGYLVSLGSSTENDFVAQTFTDTEGWYIGMKQNSPAPALEPAGGWEWASGEPMAYTRWHPGEPNNYFGAGEDYAMMLLGVSSAGTWHDVKIGGYPETSNYRGIIEQPTLGAGERNFFVSSVHGRSNIFDAGLASSTQGGILPPSINLTGLGGKVLHFPKIHGKLNTGVDLSGPDGAHTPGRSCNLNAVGGISGYVNGNNTPALVGVFLGAAQPSTAPAAIDFSASQTGENFTTLSPLLGQIFFIGDGLTSQGVAQQFTIPAGAEKLYFGYPDGHTGQLYHGPPLGWSDNSESISVRATIAPDPVPTIGLTFPITGGQLHVGGGTSPFNFTLLSGALPPGLVLSSTGLVTGTAGNGPYSFTVKVTDANGAHANRSFSGVIQNPIQVPTSLVSWWSAGNTLADVIGNNHGSMKNGPLPGPGQPGGQSYGPGKVGRAIVLDGVNDFIQVPHDPSQDITGDLTIEGWIHPTANSVSEPTIISKRSLDNNNCTYVLFLRGDGRLSFASRNGGGVWQDPSTTAVVPLNQWTHVAATIGSGQLKLYINGAVAFSGAYAVTRPSVTASLTIGATITNTYTETNPSGPFPGSIDELALYSRALSAQEISALHLSGTGGKAHHDISRDFAPISNPNGSWSYWRQPSNALTGTYNPATAALMTGSGTDAPLAYFVNGSSVSFNTNENYYGRDSGGTRYDWLGHQFGMGPSSSGDYAVLRWTAPASGQYAVSGNFAGSDTRPTTVDVHIFHNAGELTPAGKRYLDTYRGDGVSHTQVITVAANDTVDFLVGTGGNGWTYDSTSLAASVTLLSVTPLPKIAVEQPAGNALADGNSTLAYGAVTLGASLTKTITLRNTGTASLNDLAVTVDGSNAAEFVPPVSLSATTLAPGATLTFDVNFTPGGSGSRSAVLHIASNDTPRSPFDIALTGSGYSAVGNKVFAWGDNDNGEIGDGTTIDKLRPVPIIMTGALASQQVTQVFTSSSRSHAITADGKVYSWGYNADGQIGDGTKIYRKEPVAVNMSGALSGKVVTTLAISIAHTLALTSEGKVYSWGNNYTGQLGLGDTTDRTTPQLVQGALAGKTITSIAAAFSHSVALASDGTLYAWGSNYNGILGDGTTATRLAPVAMNTASTLLAGKTVTAITCGYYHNVVLTSDGKVFAWGFNGNGYLGDGTTTERFSPVAVNGSLTGKTVTKIVGSNYHHLALTSDNQLHAWGVNLYGNLGDGTNTDRHSPVLVNSSGALAGKTYAQIFAGGGCSMVRTTDGGLFTWGMGLGGQHGNGDESDINLPTAVDMSGVLAGRTLVTASMQGFHALVVAYAPPAPEIVVENEAGTALAAADTYRQDFGPVQPTKHKTAVITIRNTGDDLLGNIGATIDGAGATDFSVVSSSSGTTLTPGGTQTLTITFTPTAQGTREAVLHITSNDSDEPAYTVELEGYGTQPITEWREQFFETTENTGDAADDADPDGDGVENLLEFATGADPTESGVIETPVTRPLAGMIDFTYTRNKLAAAEVQWTVEWTDTLEGGWSSNGVSETVIEDDGTVETVVATLPAGPDGKRFVHLKVIRP